MQTDMTSRALMEAALAHMSEAQLAMLSNIFPRSVGQLVIWSVGYLVGRSCPQENCPSLIHDSAMFSVQPCRHVIQHLAENSGGAGPECGLSKINGIARSHEQVSVRGRQVWQGGILAILSYDYLSPHF